MSVIPAKFPSRAFTAGAPVSSVVGEPVLVESKISIYGDEVDDASSNILPPDMRTIVPPASIFASEPYVAVTA